MHRPDFSMSLAAPDGRTRACDVCTNLCEQPRIDTFIGIEMQSNLCWDCALSAAAIVKQVTDAERMAKVRAKRIPTDGTLRVTA